jgi:tetratricopeptide (TPR) repeat protein
MGTISLLAQMTARTRVLLAAACLALATLAAAPAAAQDSPAEAEARSVFDAGQVAFTAGHYADALVYFKRSYDLSHRPALLFNIGLCHDRLREDDAAIEAYDRYLAEVPTAANRGEVDGRLEALRRARARREQAAQTAQAVQPTHVAQAAEDTNDTRAADVTNDRAARGASDAPVEGPAVYETWWFWTLVGVVVVGGAVGIGVAASGDEPLQSGGIGGVVFTLGGGR